MTRAVRWTGRLLVGAGLALWSVWLAWRLGSPMNGIVGLTVYAFELIAFGASVAISAALWTAPTRTATSAERRAAPRPVTPLPTTMAIAVGLDLSMSETPPTVGSDDTGEVALARSGLRSLDPRSRRRETGPSIREIGWAVVAVEGMRRMAVVVLVVLVLLSGRFPLDVPRWELIAGLVASQALLAGGHFLLSDGLIRPGARMRWSMASIGAGLGDGNSRTGLPIRWMSTLATMVALNVAVSLRGVSDRWTHGLGVMPHDERVASMLAAAWLVAWGFAALRSLPQPTLGFYGATRRLEETSTRRLALGATLAVAAVGMVAGILPGGAPA